MFIELQIESGKFVSLLLNRIRSGAICIPYKFQYGIDKIDAYIDHVWWSDAFLQWKPTQDTPVTINLPKPTVCLDVTSLVEAVVGIIVVTSSHSLRNKWRAYGTCATPPSNSTRSSSHTGSSVQTGVLG